MAGIEIGNEMDGKTFLPAMKRQDWNSKDERSCILISYHGEANTNDKGCPNAFNMAYCK